MSQTPARKRGIRHPLGSILAVAACAVASGAKWFVAIAEWIAEATPAMRGLVGVTGEPPSEFTIRRTLQQLDGDGFDAKLGIWSQLRSTTTASTRVIAVDGKSVRGSGRPAIAGGRCRHRTPADRGQHGHRTQRNRRRWYRRRPQLHRPAIRLGWRNQRWPPDENCSRGSGSRNSCQGTIGFDCSGFTAFVLAQAGHTIPTNSGTQRAEGTSVLRGQALPGDILGYQGHVAIYLRAMNGVEYMLEAPDVGLNIRTGTARPVRQG